jgi:hypothetical protein
MAEPPESDTASIRSAKRKLETGGEELADRDSPLLTKPDKRPRNEVIGGFRAYEERLISPQRPGHQSHTTQGDQSHQRLQLLLPSVSTARVFTNSGVRFHNLRIEQGEDTPNLNKFALVFKDMSVALGRGKYTKLERKLPRVFDMPVFNNRNYQLVGQPELIPASSYQKFPAWKLTVKNLNDPQSVGFTPFRAQPSEPKAWKKVQGKRVHGGFKNPGAYYLGQRACRTAEDAKRMCTIVCNILNRTPRPIPEAEWQTRRDTNAGGHRPLCRWVEFAACTAYDPAFDFTEWNTMTGDSFNSGGIKTLVDYRLKKEGTRLTTGDNSTIIGLVSTDLEPTFARTTFSAQPEDIIVSKVASLILPTFPEENVSKVEANTAKLQQGVRLIRHQFVSCFGGYGTKTQFQVEAKAISDKYHTGHTTRRLDGVLDNAVFLISPDPRHGIIRLGAGAADALRHPDIAIPAAVKSHAPTGQNVRVDRVAETLRNLHRLIDLRSGSQSRALNAYACDYATQKFIQMSTMSVPDALLLAIVHLCEILDMILQGKITVAQVLGTQCQCDQEASESTPHYCQIDFRLQTCAEMFDDDQKRRICEGCVGKSSADLFTKDVRSRVRTGLTGALQRDLDAGIQNVPSIDEMTVALQPSIKDDHRWQNVYGKLYDIREARWARGTGPHPKVCSVEKFFDLFVDIFGRLFLHHMENIGLTLDCINRLKGTALPACLLVFKRMLELRKAKSGVFAGYHSEQVKHWEALENACDNEYKIRHAYVARAPRHRINTPITRVQFEQFLANAKTLTWDGEVPVISRLAFMNPTIRAEIASRGKNATKMYSEDELVMLHRLVDEIEASPILNPHRLEIPRCDDRSPWFWRERDRGSHEGWRLGWFECAGRLKTMLEICDPDNDHDESTMKMFLEFVVQWFRTGGKCHIFGMEFTLFANHLQSLSVGRGVWYLDAQGQPTDRPIRPGAPMATGWPSGFSKAADYDPTRCTIVVESWKANTYRYNYPVGPELIPMLEGVIEDIADATEYYSPLEMDPSKYYNVDLAADFAGTKYGHWISSSASDYAPSLNDADDEDGREQEETERDAIGNVVQLHGDQFDADRDDEDENE